MKIQINQNSISENNNKTEYPFIDIAKLIAALLVIAIHVAPFGRNTIYDNANFMFTQYLTRGAVPFFFISSSFFFFRKYDVKSFVFSDCFNYVKRLFKLYGLWTLIYLYYIINNIIKGRKTVGRVLLETVFAGSYLHLWYFTALITGIIITSFLLSKKISIIKISFISLILYFIGLLGQGYYVILASNMDNPLIAFIIKWYPEIFINTRNGLFEGFFFVCIGLIFAKKIIKISFPLAIIGAVISEALLIVETTYIKYHSYYLEEDLFISLIPLCFFVFYIVSHIKINIDPKISKHIRLLSSLIFYIHLFVLACFRQLASIIKFPSEEQTSYILPVILLSFIVAEIIIFLSNTKYFKFLKHLYK